MVLALAVGLKVRPSAIIEAVEGVIEDLPRVDV